MRRTAQYFDIIFSLVVILFVLVICGCTPIQTEQFATKTLPVIETTTKAIGTTATIATDSPASPITPYAATIAALAASALALERIVSGAIANRKPLATVAYTVPTNGGALTTSTTQSPAPLSVKSFGG
jgi:hypothetical protein